jgi:hypothetical protein
MVAGDDWEEMESLSTGVVLCFGEDGGSPGKFGSPEKSARESRDAPSVLFWAVLSFFLGAEKILGLALVKHQQAL